MITSWSYGVNHLPEYNHGTLYLREEPWWLALLGGVIELLGYGCHLVHWVRMPTFLYVTDDDGNRCSWRDYYGTLGSLWHIYVWEPLFQWHDAHPKSRVFEVEVGYAKVREVFRERDAKFFAEHAMIGER